MKKLILTPILLLSGWAFAQDYRGEALELLTHGYSTESRIEQPSFAFYESCEPMTAKLYGIDPIDGHERELEVQIRRKRFESGSPAPRRRSVLILPPTGGVNRLDEQYAEQLCDKGIEAWIMTAWDRGQNDYSLDEDLFSHDIAGLRGISAVRQIVRHMRGDLGVLGTSAGGILAAVALAVEPRLKTGVLIAAGADLPEIVATSDLPNLQALRRQRMLTNGWSLPEYKQALRESVILDPRWFADELSSKRIGTVVALRDKTVPLRQQLYLEELAGATRITDFDDDHFNCILLTGLLDSWKVVNFFRQNL